MHPNREFHPDRANPSPRDLEALAQLVQGRRCVVLSGAGCSTESGIPDYRGPGTRRRARNPMQYASFIRDEAARRRYWARAVVGWKRFAGASPNPAHHALAALERAGAVEGIVTQNVDRLHQAAGSRRVVELHGALANVRCLACRAHFSRAEIQRRLLELNPGWERRHAELNPDGDAELPNEHVQGFRVVSCERCSGVLKPDVVYFGESVPAAVVDAAWSLVLAADVLLVVGSSLAVFSGFRFVRGASTRGQPVALVNLGPTRADSLASLRIEARAGEVLPALAEMLGAPDQNQLGCMRA